MNIKKAISCLLLSALVCSTFSICNVKDNYAASFDSSTKFSMSYASDGMLDFYAGNQKIGRNSSSFGIGRDFVYGSYDSFYYKCRDRKSGETLQELVDSESMNISDQMAENCDKLGWLRTRVLVESPEDNAKCTGYAIDYYYDSIDLGQSKRTTAKDVLKKGFTIKNELQTSIPKLADYHMPLVTKIKIYEGAKYKLTLTKGDTYKLTKDETVAQVVIEPDNYAYAIYLESEDNSSSSSATTKSPTTKKTTNKESEVQTDDNDNTPVRITFVASGFALLVGIILLVFNRVKQH